MLAVLKVGQEIEYQVQVGKYNGKHWQMARGRVVQVTDRHIAIQCAKYPDSIPICDLVSGQAKITEPAMDWSAVRLENRQEPVLVGKAEPYITWKERREREGADTMANKKYDWDTFGPRVVAMMAKGMGIPEIARELDYPYYAVRDYVTRHVPMKKPSEDTCPARREDYEIPETVNWTVTESPHPASVPELPDDTFNGLGADIQTTEMREKPVIQDSGERHTFETGAVRDMQAGKGAPAYMPAEALLRLSVHYENGAIKYGVGNYLLGINVSSFLNSAIRHLWKYMAGQDDEDHLAAAAFNILGVMQMEATKPELVDMAAREGKRSFVYGRFE